MAKKQRIYVDKGIEQLVQSLNQIEGVKTYASCEGHENGPIVVGMECTIEAGILLMRIALRHTGISFRIRVGHRQGRERTIAMAGLTIGTLPGCKSRKHELKDAFLKDLQNSGLMTQSFKGKVLTESKPEPLRPVIQKKANETKECALMTQTKFRLLSSFVCEKWQEQVDFLRSQIEHNQNYLHTSTANLPILSGSIDSGHFFYNPDEENFWNIEWKKRRIQMYFMLNRLQYYATCLADITNIPLSGEVTCIIPQLLVDDFRY